MFKCYYLQIVSALQRDNYFVFDVSLLTHPEHCNVIELHNNSII